MSPDLLKYIVCPLTGSELILCEVSKGEYNSVQSGVLCSSENTVYPIIEGVPRLIPEAIFDYHDFLSMHVPNFTKLKEKILAQFGDIINAAVKETRRTKQSFTVEWDIYNYSTDKTWHLTHKEMVTQFLNEANIDEAYLKGKTIADIGCGNGVLTQYMAKMGATAIGMDLSLSIKRGSQNALNPNVHFLQGDLHLPPFRAATFDHVHSSGVLHHTSNTNTAFKHIIPLAKNPRKLSIWLYHPIDEIGHKFMMWCRRWTTKLPSKLQYWLYFFTLLPLTLISRGLKGSFTPPREIMVDLMDFFSPEFRWEHDQTEVLGWYEEEKLGSAKITTENRWGFSVSNVGDLD